MGLLYGKNCTILTTTVFARITRVTDRQTDRQTDGRTDEIAIAYARLQHTLSRAIMMKLIGNPVDVAVCAAASTSREGELDVFHEELETAKSQCMSQEMISIMGDLNTKVGEGRRQGQMVGPLRLGERNEYNDHLRFNFF